MYSNFVTPPDFVDEYKHTVTIIDATEKEVELLTSIAKNSYEDYNFYLYRSEMNDLSWLSSAIARSAAVIINFDKCENTDFFKNDNVFYYGQMHIISPAKRIGSLVDYFSQLKKD
jgi:hypothetical protein